MNEMNIYMPKPRAPLPVARILANWENAIAANGPMPGGSSQGGAMPENGATDPDAAGAVSSHDDIETKMAPAIEASNADENRSAHSDENLWLPIHQAALSLRDHEPTDYEVISVPHSPDFSKLDSAAYFSPAPEYPWDILPRPSVYHPTVDSAKYHPTTTKISGAAAEVSNPALPFPMAPKANRSAEKRVANDDKAHSQEGYGGVFNSIRRASSLAS